jgi:hypothetical protein
MCIEEQMCIKTSETPEDIEEMSQSKCTEKIS